jgi:ribonuclease P protein component
VAENLSLEDEQKEEKQYLPKMIKLESLKKSEHFKHVLTGKKLHTNFYSIFATKNFLKPKKKKLFISFVAKKKIGNAVKRNRIKRKLKAITLKILKIKGAINTNYTYIIICKTKSYTEKYDKIFLEMQKSFKKLN